MTKLFLKLLFQRVFCNIFLGVEPTQTFCKGGLSLIIGPLVAQHVRASHTKAAIGQRFERIRSPRHGSSPPSLAVLGFTTRRARSWCQQRYVRLWHLLVEVCHKLTTHVRVRVRAGRDEFALRILMQRVPFPLSSNASRLAEYQNSTGTEQK